MGSDDCGGQKTIVADLPFRGRIRREEEPVMIPVQLIGEDRMEHVTRDH
jgi:hypothetical protein